MTQIITFFSPKTSGASSLILNAACLHQTLCPTKRIGLIEFSPMCSQQVLFPTETNHSWEELWPFYETEEWNSDLLSRVKFDLGVEILWSPTMGNFPVFEASKAMALLDLAKQRYDFLYVDLSQSTPKEWQNFALESTSQLVGVMCPDPLGVSAWQHWQKNLKSSIQQGLVINQVLPKDASALTAKFTKPELSFTTTVPTDVKLMWQQNYLQFPAVWHKRSAYKKAVEILIANWILK